MELTSLAKEYLVGDVLLLQRCMTFGVNEGWMSHQITPVLHYEAPVPKQVMAFIHMSGCHAFEEHWTALALKQTRLDLCGGGWWWWEI